MKPDCGPGCSPCGSLENRSRAHDSTIRSPGSEGWVFESGPDVKRGCMRFFEMVHGVYFDDLDAFQILHNARYVLLIERTIGAFWDQVFGWSGLMDQKTNPDQSQLVRANHIEYENPVVGVGEVRVRIWIEKLGRSSLTFGFRVLPVDQDLDYAVGQRVMVRIDPETRRSVPWTDLLREKVQPYCLPSAPA